MTIFVQLGATRDEFEPYLHAAHARGMQAVLVETPDYIQLRKQLGRQEFDRTLAVEHPANEAEVLSALKNQLPESPALVLAGFERYIYTAYAVAKKLRIPPYRECCNFTPPDKAEQRWALSRWAPTVYQPAYTILPSLQVSSEDLADMDFPLVVKPVDGGGGLGVFLVSSWQELTAALAELKATTNYDGGHFEGFLVEEFVPGIEYSVQGLARDGVGQILTFCKKVISIDSIPGKFVRTFHEVGHIAARGNEADRAVKDLVQQCINTFGYQDGPFHLDFVRCGSLCYYLEMGFRLSANAVVSLVQRVGGYDWAEETFRAHLGTISPRLTALPADTYMGQITAVSHDEISTARNLHTKGYKVDVQRFNAPPIIPSSRLRSDLMHHSGSLGRIMVSGPTLEEVELLLHVCAPQRALRHTGT